MKTSATQAARTARFLRTTDGGKTWTDQETGLQTNFYAMRAYGREDVIVVGELGTVQITKDGGKTWEAQPNVTSNSLQAVAFLGGTNLWIAGSGGTILKRTTALSTVRTQIPVSIPPVLKIGASKNKPKPRQPLITITDDGDIPLAAPPAKEKQ